MSFLLRLTLLALPALASAQHPNAVTLERLPNGHWMATYHLTAPVTALRFERPASFFRAKVWTPLTPGYRFVREGDREVAALDSGVAPRADVAFEFREYAETLPKEYELFQVFSGGSVAIYTGHFFATARFKDQDSAQVRTVIAAPPRGAHAVVGGKVFSGPAASTDGGGDGTYIYLGTATPIETADMLAIVDPAMPAWLATQFARELPRLFAAYRQRFGYPLDWKPLVLYSFHDTASTGLSSGGGTLTGLVNMDLTGSKWKEETPAASEQAFYLIAHEASHLWNGHLAENVDQAAGSWMHEGSADAFASQMLLSLGVIDSARYRARVEDAINRCAKAESTGSMATSLTRGATKQVYDCGMMLALWSAAAVRQIKPSSDLFTVWHDLITAAHAAGGRYDQRLYFSTLRGEGVPDSVVSAMQSFIAGKDSMIVAIRGLRDAGVAINVGEGAPPAAFQQELSRSALVHLMSQACRRTNLTWGPPARTGAVTGCEPFATEHLVSAIDGHSLADDGARAYDAVAAACASRGTVALNDDDGTTIVRVPCTQAVAPRPVWYRLAR